ncbi:hypothetical protein ACHQIS_19935 [Raoultella ornithinolytica]|uniref:hypothetical protein n=1 Tax=Raoultella ornithinolytica TaxID=54291 RepID=UPI003981C382
MTITLQAVNELIASLESAGELSIKERKYLDLAKAYVQLAAENVGLIRSAECLLHEASEVYRAYNKTQLPDGDLVDGQSLQEVWDAINATPVTDRIVAGIKADGLPANIAEIIDSGDLETICYESERSYAEDFRLALYNFRQLREGADK